MTSALLPATVICPLCSHWWGTREEFSRHVAIHRDQIILLNEAKP